MKFRINWLFGITDIPFEKAELPFVFGNESPFSINIKSKDNKTTNYKVSFSQYGKIDEEKLEIKRHFLPDYDLENIPSPLSLEIIFRDKIEEKDFTTEKIEKRLEEHLQEIKRVVERFYNAYRKLVFIKQTKDNDNINDIAFTIKRNAPLSFKELKTFLFYKAILKRKIIRGTMSEGEGADFGNLQKAEIRIFKNFLKKEQSLPESWLFAGYVSYHEERYGEAIISAAIALESAISLWLKTKLETKDLIQSEIDKLLDNASKRDVLLIIFRLLKRKVDKNLTVDIKTVFERRNAIVHGKQKYTKREDAEKALATCSNLLKILNYF